MTNPAPLPWKWDGTTLTDANGKLVCILAQRLREQEVLIAEIMAAREMHRLLIAVENHLSTALTDGLLLDDVREILNRLGCDE